MSSVLIPEQCLTDLDISGALCFEEWALQHGINTDNSRDGGLIDAYIPANLIDFEEVPVKEEWAQSLAKEMRDKAAENGGSGQLTPIILGYIEGEPTLKIIDGFHRDAAMRINGEPIRYATIVKTTWDKLYDDRIFLAKDHAHVRFSRVVQWIREAWSLSGLADKLTVEQAVLLYRFGSSGSKLQLTPHEADTAKAWIARKEKQWQMAAMTIHGQLKIAENVDPLLVHSTREKRDSHKLEAPTQAIIKIFSDELPNNFALQRLVMKTAMDHNLKGPQVKAVCLAVANCAEEQQALLRIDELAAQDWRPAYGDTTNRALRRAYDPRHKGAEVLSRIIQDVERIRERTGLSISRNEAVDEFMHDNLVEARQAVDKTILDLARLVSELTVLIGDNRKPSVPAATNLPLQQSVSQSAESIDRQRERPSQTKVHTKDAYSVILRAYLAGDDRVAAMPPITTAAQLELTKGQLELYEFVHGWSPRADEVRNLIDQAEGQQLVESHSSRRRE